MSERPEPPSSPVSAPFWEATRERRLVLQWCGSCNATIHYPREACPHCFGSELGWRESAGRGVVHATTVMHQPAHPAFADRVPYVVALVELEEGVRMLTNIVGCDPAQARVGRPVRVAWEDLSDGRALPMFELVDEEGS
ncbi:MAG: Zn-ribbon domain-containing OB-fold protein [Myxococcota bacterium]